MPTVNPSIPADPRHPINLEPADTSASEVRREPMRPVASIGLGAAVYQILVKPQATKVEKRLAPLSSTFRPSNKPGPSSNEGYGLRTDV
ncbi:hypothetical protein Landi51_08831 [Colletotrichum acutatum]